MNKNETTSNLYTLIELRMAAATVRGIFADIERAERLSGGLSGIRAARPLKAARKTLNMIADANEQLALELGMTRSVNGWEPAAK